MEDRDLLIASIHSESLRKSFSNKYCDEDSTFIEEEFLNPFKDFKDQSEVESEGQINLDFLKPKTSDSPDPPWHEMPDREATEEDIREWTAIQLRSYAEKDRFYKSSYGKLQKIPKKYQVGVIGSRKPKSLLSHLVKKIK